MIVTIPYKPRYPQNIIHPELERHRFSVLVAHRRLGKTVMGINHAVKMALKNRLPMPRYAYLAPFLKQAKLIAWDYLKRYTAVLPGVKINEAELYVDLPNHARIWLFGADNPDAIRGTYLDGVIPDEYAQMKPDVFPEVLRPALADRNGWALFLGTPKGQNQFYEVYQFAMKRMAENDPNWWAGIYRADETGVIPDEELKQLKAVLPDGTYRQEFLCDFTASADNVLITIDLVTDAANRGYKPGDVKDAPRIIGVDPARYGNDRSVIIKRQGLQAFTPKIFSGIDNMALVGHLLAEINEFKPDAVFVDAGRGEGVIDRCRQLGYRVIEVNFGGKASKDSFYVNKRTEMWDLMREWMEQGGSIPNLPDLKTDLVIPTYDYDIDRMRLVSKEKIKEKLGRSPDIGDALALTFSFPVKRKALWSPVEVARSEYDVWKGPQSEKPYDPLSMVI